MSKPIQDVFSNYLLTFTVIYILSMGGVYWALEVLKMPDRQLLFLLICIVSFLVGFIEVERRIERHILRKKELNVNRKIIRS